MRDTNVCRDVRQQSTRVSRLGVQLIQSIREHCYDSNPVNMCYQSIFSILERFIAVCAEDVLPEYAQYTQDIQCSLYRGSAVKIFSKILELIGAVFRRHVRILIAAN